MSKFSIVPAGLFFALLAAAAPPPAVIELAEPERTGGMPLKQAIAERRTQREFSSRALEPQLLSELLFSAWGISSPDGKRTVPTARNQQDLLVYAAFADGVYFYDAAENVLTLVKAGDYRRQLANRAGDAPLVLIFVSDRQKQPRTADGRDFAAVHAGGAVQNVYLYCTSAGLSTVVCGGFDRIELEKELELPDSQEIQLTQVVGYPAENDRER